MRVVAGTLRGRALVAPSGDGTRPTVDRVREALFSSLYSLRGGFEGAQVLDAFAGSGALGIEALSRGAAHATFYESNAKAADVVKRNLATCGLGPDVAAVVRRDVLNSPPVSTRPAFDLVFLDPPYAYDEGEVLGLVDSLAQAGALAPGALVVYEHDLKRRREVTAALEESGFTLKADKKYGKTGVTIFQVGEEAS